MKKSPSLAVAAGAALMLVASLPVSVAVPLGADGDADGVPDERDACFYSPRGIVVGPNGCSTPGDEDEDQVADAVDACPQSPAGALVDAQGCALDQDLDGVADGVDRCVGSGAGARVDARGCAPGQVATAAPMRRAQVPVAIAPPPPPPMATPVVPSAAPPVAAVPIAAKPAAPTPKPKPPVASGPAEPDRTFYFDPGESDLGWGNSRAVKQSARELMLELEHNPALALVVSGHGDIKFDGMSVPRVSLARATTVRDALVAAGVPAQRITMRVPGINEPRFYREDQPRNCRVELRVFGRTPAPAPAPAPDPAPAVAAATPPPPAAPVPAPTARVFPDPPARVLPPPPPPRTVAPPPPPSAPLSPLETAAPVATQGVPTPRTLARAAVSFEPFSAVLDDKSIRELNGFVQTATRVMLADTASRVAIVSGIGTGEAGATAQRLAESRAGSVGAYLVSLGLPHNRMDVSNQAQTGERRVDVSVVSR